MTGISMVIGQIEEAQSALADGDIGTAVRALANARNLLSNAMQAQRVAVFEAPIRQEEIRRDQKNRR